MAFKPIDPQRDLFRRYLERAGVMEELTKVFVKIVKERPENPLEFLRENLGSAVHEKDTVTYLQKELDEAKIEINRLKEIIRKIETNDVADANNSNNLEKKEKSEVLTAQIDEKSLNVDAEKN